MTSAVPYFAEARSGRAASARRAPKPLSLTQTLGIVGLIAGIAGGSASGLDVINGTGHVETIFLWAILAASSAITWVLGSIEARILSELRKPIDN
jgi:hypothetical protein